MCTRMIDTERFRAHLKHEFHYIDKTLEATSAKLGSSADAAAAATLSATSTRIHPKIETEAPDVKATIAATTFDHVHGTTSTVAAGVIPDWKKTAKDVWYHPKLLPRDTRRVSGTCNCQAAGEGPIVTPHVGVCAATGPLHAGIRRLRVRHRRHRDGPRGGQEGGCEAFLQQRTHRGVDHHATPREGHLAMRQAEEERRVGGGGEAR
jgi:hypothetical protein